MVQKKILLVGPNLPRVCGIASHVFQLSASLRKEGCIVDILSPKDCEGLYHENLIGGLNLLKLLKYSNDYVAINIHFSPEEYFYTGRRNVLRIFNLLPVFSFLILFKLVKQINVVIHEPPMTKYFFQRTLFHRLVWKQVPKISFFTNEERKILEKNLGISFGKDQYCIEKVNNNFITFTEFSKKEARKKLNLDENMIIFLCIGFIAESKGFDRIAKLFTQMNLTNSILHITGSVRLKNDKISSDYFYSLKRICQNNNRIFLTNKFLSYEDFDIWTIASDYVVFPYRECSNSGVLGRAKLFNKTVIVSGIGGLKDQINLEDFIFKDDMELRDIIKNIDANYQKFNIE